MSTFSILDFPNVALYIAKWNVPFSNNAYCGLTTFRTFPTVITPSTCSHLAWFKFKMSSDSDREACVYNRDQGQRFRIVAGFGKKICQWEAVFSHFSAAWPRWFADRQNGNVTGASCLGTFVSLITFKWLCRHFTSKLGKPFHLTLLYDAFFQLSFLFLMASTFLALVTTLENLGARWLLAKKVNFVPWQFTNFSQMYEMTVMLSMQPIAGKTTPSLLVFAQNVSHWKF